MKKLFLFGVWFAAALFVGCDESGTSASADESSSSAAVSGSSSSAKSSDSKKAVSSSSVNVSSSSVIPSEVDGSSSSFSCESEVLEQYLNPEIDYGSMIDKRDCHVYKTVKIGSQTWMAENLNFEYKINGITYGTYVNSGYTGYGRYYFWTAAMDSAVIFSTDGRGCGDGSKCSPATIVRGICPDGWHLPDTTEWQTLFAAAGGQSSAGKVLKSCCGWYNGGYGTDSLGFSAIPVGNGYRSGNFIGDGYGASFWSSTEYSSDFAYSVNLNYYYEDANLGYVSKDDAFSIRCLKNSN